MPATIVMERLEPQRESVVFHSMSGLKGSRVELEGACMFYMEGTAEI